MNGLEAIDTIGWWCIKSTSPHHTKEQKQVYQDRLDKVVKLVDELNDGEVYFIPKEDL